MEFEKSDLLENEHTITSNQSLCCKETGRVVAQFYNDYDLDHVIDTDKNLRKLLEIAKEVIVQTEQEDYVLGLTREIEKALES